MTLSIFSYVYWPSLTICICSLEKCLFRSFAHFFKLDCLALFGVEFCKVFIILDIDPLSDISWVNMSCHQWVAFLFCWWFPLLCKNFVVWCIPICLFIFLLFLFPDEIYQKKYRYENCLRFYCLYVILGFLWLQVFKYLIHFEYILVYGVRRWSSFIFCMLSVQCFSTPFIE